MTTKAVVFAYHNIGARCLRVLRAHGIDVPLVVTHADDPGEVQWFDRVADVADDLRLSWIAPPDASAPECVARIAALAPDFVFSFYYRRMLNESILALPRLGALNMHGSLLPRYRGRAPVNWAVLHGERETGATLHYMIDKPDAGDIVAQQAVPILPDDTAREVADKVTVAAEICLDGVLPALVAGTASRRPNDIARGSYFGGRTPEDGRIDWTRHAREVHDLVRAVAPPYPGARTLVGGAPARILRTRLLDPDAPAVPPSLTIRRQPPSASMNAQHGGRPELFAVARCGGGGTLQVDALEIEGTMTSPALLYASHGIAPLALG
ncbi:MAG TPA: formyltransferase [Casimicrobiaceae bacterium]|nr:formyltransferase [Casimicrobiaceae bacterium]